MNEISIEFMSPIVGALQLAETMETEIPPKCPPEVYNGECHMNMLRKMQASFAWDWGLAAPSMGLWKTAYLDIYDSIIIRDITYQLTGGNPHIHELDAKNYWTLKIFVHIETGMKETEFQGVVVCGLM